MTVGIRLKDERERLRLTQTAFAEVAEVSKRSVIDWEKGVAAPNAVALGKMASAGADVAYIVTGLPRDEVQNTAPLSLPVQRVVPGAHVVLALDVGATHHEYCLVPRYDVRASAGPGVSGADGEEQIGAFAFELTWMQRHFGRSGQGFACVLVHGDSMQPTLLEGDEIIVDMHITRVDVSGIYVLSLRGNLLVKRVQCKLDGSLIVKSDNPAYEPEHITAALADDFRVVGRLVWPRVR